MTTSFDSVSQQWLIRFLKHRINDTRMLRLIQKWLKAGVLEDAYLGTELIVRASATPLLAAARALVALTM